MEIRNVLAEIGKHPASTFIDLVNFNDHSIGACDITGVSPVWEMHPDTDELFYVVEGYFEITLLDKNSANSEPIHHRVEAGAVFVVPKGIWHRPGAPEGAKFLYFTPGISLHSNAEDPRLS